MGEMPLFTGETLAEVLAQVRAGTSAHKAWLTWPLEDGRAGAMSRGEADSRLDEWGRQFAAWGLRPGDRVLVASRDDAAVATSVIACFTWGLSAAVLDPDGTAAETQPLIGLAKPAAWIMDAALVAAWEVESVQPRGAALTGGLAPGQGRGDSAPSSWAARLLRRPAPAAPFTPPLPASPDDAAEAYVLFTSGSTSRPKGVCISRGALLAHVRTLVRQLRHDADSRLVDPLLLHHTDGLVQGPVLAWLAGATCLRPMRFEVPTLEEFCVSLYRDRATHLIAVPTILSLILEGAEGLADTFDFRDFRIVVSTGGALGAGLWKRFEEKFRVRIANVYGLTETVTGGCFSGPDDASHRHGTVGKPVDCEVEITDEAGRPVPAGVAGELRMKGTHLMTGYLNDPEATAAALHDGWLRTGDLATRDGEGFVRIVGRLKSVVISAGQNIQPEEVDDVLRGVPGVRDAATFGIPDDRFGEILVGCVEIAEGSGLTEGVLVEACRGKISSYKVPRSLALVERLPRGPAGKVEIPAARHLFEEKRRQATLSATPAGGADVSRRVLELAAEIFHVAPERLSVASSPADTAGWDSFGHLSFVEALEHAFRFRLSTREVMSLKTIGDAERLVRAKTRPEAR
ncbi:MAG: AMP-binding protein [Planctomycetes bacterium]|nr:AMP-binding protein [Planctomycetota bacterium]